MSMINLGRPVSRMTEPAPIESQNEQMMYPSLYLSDREGISAAPSVGTEGEATIRFRVVSKTESERAGDTSTSVDLEVMSIEFSETESDEDDEIERGLRQSEQEIESDEDEEEEK